MRIEYLSLLENVLGVSQYVNGNDIAFYCPNCGHHKPKLYVNVDKLIYHCWVCHMKGRGLYKLLRESGRANKSHFVELKRLNKVGIPKYDMPVQNTSPAVYVKLPENAYPIFEVNSAASQYAIDYLHRRGMNDTLIRRYDIHFGVGGDYDNRVIFPSYDKTMKLVHYSGRHIDEYGFPKYIGVSVSKRTLIGFEHLINWKLPVVLTEGEIDAVTIRHNAIPLFGTYLGRRLKTRLVEHRPVVIVCMDGVAKTYAMQICKQLYDEGLKVYYTPLPHDDDPNSLGYDRVWYHISNAHEITYKYLIEHKLQIDEN